MIYFRLANKLPTTKSREKIGNHVTTASANIGLFLFSKNFNRCQAVIAKLHDGQFALYHAFTTLDDTDGFTDFIKLVKDKIDYIYVIQKQMNIENFKKAPCLAWNLSKHLGIEVNRINVNNYQAIIADAKSNKVVICMNINFFHPDQSNMVELHQNSVEPINIKNVITLQDSINEVIVEHHYDVKIKNNIVISGKYEFPVELVSESVLSKCRNGISIQLYEVAKLRQIKKVNKLIENGASLELAMKSAVTNSDLDTLTF